MPQANPGQDIDQARIMLGLLESVERDGGQSQRRLASDLGIALGLVNAYMKRCVKKGLLKAGNAPARRYFYYLTPQGFAEKSRLTVEYLSYSLGFFRQAKIDCAAILQEAQSRDFLRVVLTGKSDLSEIIAICAMDTGVSIVAVVDGSFEAGKFIGRPLCASFDDVGTPFDAVVVSDLISTRRAWQEAVTRFGTNRVLVPALLEERLREPRTRVRS